MSYNNLELVRHILDEVIFILQHTNGKTKDETVQDAVLSRAIVRSLEIIGEAARKTTPDFKTSHPGVEWKKWAAQETGSFMIILALTTILSGKSFKTNFRCLGTNSKE